MHSVVTGFFIFYTIYNQYKLRINMYFLYTVYVFFIHLLNKTITIKTNKMKSKLFTSAWALFRKYNITFSQALVKAWSDFKRQSYIAIYNSIPSKPQFAKKKLEAKKMYERFNAVGFELVSRNIINNVGAIHYYDGATLNMD